MSRVITIAVMFSVVLALFAAPAAATPSSHLWTPSVDIQFPKGLHLTTDVYVPTKKPRGVRPGTVTNLGLTYGLWHTVDKKVGVEVGFDHIEGTYPLYLNAKVGSPEGAFGENSPALCAGLYSVGMNRNGEARTGRTAKTGTDYDIYYAKAAKTFKQLGRLSAGWYTGNRKLLVDENGNPDEDGVMLAWERGLPEIHEQLALSIDYMSGNSSSGALAYGFAWTFTPGISVSFGFVDQNNDKIAPGNTFVVEVDIDFEVPKFGKKN